MEKKRFYSLDIIKFVAAVLIIFHHYQQSFKLTFNGVNYFGGKIYVGYIVELFFLLSGFFMAMGYERYGKQDFGKFFYRRAMRLFPMVWITVTAHAVILIAYRYIVGKPLSETGLWKYILSMSLTFEGGFVKLEKAYNNPIWYLSALLLCYVIFWLVAHYAIRKKTSPLYFYAGLVLVGLGIIHYEMEVPLFNSDAARGVIPFFFGCCLYMIYDRVDRKKVLAGSAVILIIAAAAAAVSFDTYYDDLQMILIFMVYPAIIMFFLTSRVVDIVFNHKVFGELGKISFEMYIWHVPTFSLIKLLMEVGVLNVPRTYMGMYTVTAAITILAAAMYYLVERPINNRLFSTR